MTTQPTNLQSLSDDDLFDEIRDVVNQARGNRVVASAEAFRERCRAIGAEMRRREWQKDTPYYNMFQPEV